MAKTKGDGASGKPIKVTRNRTLGPNRAAQHAQRDADRKHRAEVKRNSATERAQRRAHGGDGTFHMPPKGGPKGKTTRRRS